jgi:hypothetical protein
MRRFLDNAFRMVRFGLIVSSSLGVASRLGQNDGAAHAEDFRVDNAAYAADKKEPTSESSTIFHEGVVYDCMKSPAETVVFDKAAGRFVLLDLKRKLRAELPLKQLDNTMEALRKELEKSKVGMLRFLAEPKFEETSDEQTNEVTLESPWLTYRVTFRREPNQAVVAQYCDFCDVYMRLNAALRPGSLPPFGRLVLNEAVAKRHAIPARVFLTLYTGKGVERRQTTMHSEHKFVIPLNSSDLERVKETRKLMEGFKLVTFEKYAKAK